MTAHEDYDAGENGGAMTDGDYYDATAKGERDGAAPRLVLSEITLSAIQAEATRAHLKHGDHSMLGKHYSSGDRLAILIEEVGEVAHELTYDSGGPGVGEGRRDELVKELIQVAAMAASWVEYLVGGVPGRWRTMSGDGMAPGQAALKLAFENWFGSTGYDEQGRFDMDEMEFAFEAVAETGRDLAAAAAQPDLIDEDEANDDEFPPPLTAAEAAQIAVAEFWQPKVDELRARIEELEAALEAAAARDADREAAAAQPAPGDEVARLRNDLLAEIGYHGELSAPDYDVPIVRSGKPDIRVIAAQPAPELSAAALKALGILREARTPHRSRTRLATAVLSAALGETAMEEGGHDSH